ncbi:MAG: DsbA family protein [Burkholderiaceae bacterium]|nr:DsbA family protein [Burkholderiaceae bacterium]
MDGLRGRVYRAAMNPAPRTAVDFWFDFSSPYSYIANEWVDALAARHGRHDTVSPQAAADWARAAFRAYWTRGVLLSDPVALKALAAESGLDADAAEAAWNDAPWKQRLKTENDAGLRRALLHRRRRALLGQRPQGAARALAGQRAVLGGCAPLLSRLRGARECPPLRESASSWASTRRRPFWPRAATPCVRDLVAG